MSLLKRSFGAKAICALVLFMIGFTNPIRAGLPLDTNGLIGHWDFEEDSGAVVKDVSGHGLDGTIQGAVIRAGGLRGKALFLDGSTRAVVPFDSILNLKKFTLISWVKSSERYSWQTFLSRQVPAGKPINYRLQISGMDGTKWNFMPHRPIMGYWNPDPDPDSGNVIGTTDVSEGRWHQVVGTFDGVYERIYVDGRLEGTHHQDIPPVANDTEPLTLGASNYQGGSYFLTGLMDEVSIYDRALGAASIEAEFRGKHPEVNLGMRTHFGKPGDTVTVPLYLANFLGQSLSSAQFTLRFDSSIATLIDVAMDSGLGSDWPLHEWNRDGGNAVAVAMGGAPVPFGYGEGELLRFRFVIRPGVTAGNVTALDLSDIELDENGTIKPTVLPGRILVTRPAGLYGDVDGNGEVDMHDANKIMLHVIGLLPLPDASLPEFTLETADVSGNGEITSYDAALVYQYGLGLIDRFPAESDTATGTRHALAKAGASSRMQASSLALEGPVSMGGDKYRYRVSGKGLRGLLSGEFEFRISDPVVKITRVGSGVKGVRLAQRYVTGGSSLELALSTNDDVDQDQVDVFEIEAEHAPGFSGAGLTLVSAYMDEGRFRGEGIATRLGSVREVKSASAPTLTMAGKFLRIGTVPGERLRLEAFDLRGKRIFLREFPSAPARIGISRSELPKGMIWLKVSSRSGSAIRAFANLRE